MYDFWDYFVAFLLLAAFTLPLVIALLIKLGLLILGFFVMLPATSRAITQQQWISTQLTSWVSRTTN